jgi:uncharacterized protein YlxW (UPF0749 family)
MADAKQRLKDALVSRPTRGQVVVAILFCALGFAFAIQVQSTQEGALNAARTSDLVRILDDLGEQRERLAGEAASLQATLDELRTGADRESAARQEARERLETLGILAGTVPAVGPGIVLTVSDPEDAVDAADLLDAVQELRDAGAEAMQINDVRIVGSSSFIDSSDGIVIDGEVVAEPYLIRAIGDPDTLASALAIPGGVIEGLSESGARAVVAEGTRVAVTALKDLPTAEYARPA